jgi:ribA/ribD-fused uncharacterized protein
MSGQKAQQEQFHFFYGGPFSQWAFSPFTLNGIWYKTAEHYMMWFKDQVFGGTLSQRILAADHPLEAKNLGREIPNFNLAVWNAVAKQGVYRGNMGKFTQNPLMLFQLMETHGYTLVEASPTDVIWGIGLSEYDPLRLDRTNWKGTNWLGEVIEEVRDTLALAYRWHDDPAQIGNPIPFEGQSLVDHQES